MWQRRWWALGIVSFQHIYRTAWIAPPIQICGLNLNTAWRVVYYIVNITYINIFTLMDEVTCRVSWLGRTDITTDGQWCYMGVQRWGREYIFRFGLVTGAASRPPQRLQMKGETEKMDRNAAIVPLLHSCQRLWAHGDGDKRMHFQYCVGQCPLANTRKERTKPSTQKFQADLPEMYFSSIVALTSQVQFVFLLLQNLWAYLAFP